MSNADKPGFKNPPKATRFKPGTSGNPRDRPKGTRNLGTDLTDILKRQVSVRENGKERRISRQAAMLLKLLACKVSAASLHKMGILQYLRGDFRPIRDLLVQIRNLQRLLDVQNGRY
jgi:hypothetical protein